MHLERYVGVLRLQVFDHRDKVPTRVRGERRRRRLYGRGQHQEARQPCGAARRVFLGGGLGYDAPREVHIGRLNAALFAGERCVKDKLAQHNRWVGDHHLEQQLTRCQPRRDVVVLRENVSTRCARLTKA